MKDATSSSTVIPNHVGIIMDGNGRWAQRRGKSRTAGHQAGLETAKLIVHAASEMGINYISMYTFSTENWKRAVEEVNFLMDLLARNLRREYAFYREHNIRVVHSGNLEGLPQSVQNEIKAVEAETANFTKLTLNLAINYGGRDELVRACQRLLAREGVQCAQIDEDSLSGCLDLPDIPDVDLLIRTSGEMRISNFMLWKAAYAELYFSDKLWPDWTADDLEKAIQAYSQRQRRFGGTR